MTNFDRHSLISWPSDGGGGGGGGHTLPMASSNTTFSSFSWEIEIIHVCYIESSVEQKQNSVDFTYLRWK